MTGVIDGRAEVTAQGGSPDNASDGMVWIPGGQFLMGSSHHYPEEAPSRRAAVEGFWMDRAPVTNREFAAFVSATGYRTLAECPPDPVQYPGAAPGALQPGSIVFRPPSSLGGMRFWGDWWAFVPGAHWRTPNGTAPQPEPDHPVVHVAYQDAAAYAAWAGKALPSEAEWERAAWGGQGGTEFAWGDNLAPGGTAMANTWQGRFPSEDMAPGGARTSAVGSYPPNAYGLVDMIGNVWEWTANASSYHPGSEHRACCTSSQLRSGSSIPRHVIKGGSYLCAPNYCRRYRPPPASFRRWTAAQRISASAASVGPVCPNSGTQMQAA